MVENNNKAVRLEQVFLHLIFVLACITIIFPILLTLVSSFSTEESIIRKGYTFFPTGFSTAAYEYLFQTGTIFNAYWVTIRVTVIGTVISVILTSLAGFALSSKKVAGRTGLALFFYLPTIVSAGVVAWYYNIAYLLKLKDTLMVLILPSLVGVYNIFLVRNYYKTIPDSLSESAELDGANAFQIFFKIMFPLATPITATIVLFISLGYWNDWYLASWFIRDESLYPLQYYLYDLHTRITSDASSSQGSGTAIPLNTVYLATMFVTMGPIILVYPFVQRFFIKGIIVGAVKG